MLLQPVFWRNLATPKERQRAKEIVEQYGRSSLAAIALLNDKSYYFSPTGNSVIAYVPKGRGAIALGDPITPLKTAKRQLLLSGSFASAMTGIQAFTKLCPMTLALQIIGI